MSCDSKAKQAGQASEKNGIPATAARQAAAASAPSVSQKQANQALPTQHQIPLKRVFSQKELGRLSVELRLGLAGAERQINFLRSDLPRRNRSDPRPLDWVQRDRQCYQFLSEQVSQVRRKKGPKHVDVSGLSQARRHDLADFCRLEADRAHRNIDHLELGNGQGPRPRGATAAYLTTNHRLVARFCTHLAAGLEPEATQ